MHIQEVFGLIKDDVARMEAGFKKDLNSDVYLVSKVGEYILKSGGKRFRPMVLLLASRMCGYAGDRHIPLAGVVEFIHTATLLHDDVVDRANLRRGSASANSVWGDGASILVGDYLLSKAFSLAVANGDMRISRAADTTRMAEARCSSFCQRRGDDGKRVSRGRATVSLFCRCAGAVFSAASRWKKKQPWPATAWVSA